MAKRLEVNIRLLEQAQEIGKHRTRSETINAALKEYIQRRKQREILSLFGTIDFHPDFSYQRERKAKRR